MLNEVRGGVVLSAVEAGTFEYLPNKGVFLGGLLDRAHGNPFGLYIGRIEPGSGIAKEIHPENSETIYVLSGEAVGVLGDHEIPLGAGQVLHIEKNVSHGIRNAGQRTLELLIIASPPY